MPVRVAIVGRPNVGKSTLFNRLVGRRIALVDDTPGVTRDRREEEGRIGDLTFNIIDTAGYEDSHDQSLQARMRQQTEAAISEADLIVLMIDARAGVTPLDEHFAKLLRKTNKPVHLVGNKAEGRAAEPGLLEAFSLGLGQPIALSAEHGLGLSDLHDIIREKGKEQRAQEEFEQASDDAQAPLDALPQTDVEFDADNEEELRWDPTMPLNLAIVGRPNVGKSTFINSLVQEDRLLTGPEAGITRDSIMVPWNYDGRDIRLVDTAGIRRRAKVQQKLEKLAVSDSLRSIQYAEIVILMIDATMPFEKQDLQLADLVEREGRGLIIAVNKWDLIKNKNEKLAELREACERLLPQVRGVPMITMSGLRGTNIARLMKSVFELEKKWNARISTARVNRWIDGMIAAHPPPAVSGRRLKIRYATQIKSRPPTFVIFCSRPDALPKSYLRYLTNGLRETFKLRGTPIRLWVRAGDNPYAAKAKARKIK